jgi:hypothetical protein
MFRCCCTGPCRRTPRRTSWGMQQSNRFPGNTVRLYRLLRTTHPECLAAGAVGGKLDILRGSAGVEVAQAVHVARRMRWARAQVLAAARNVTSHHGAAMRDNIG